MSFKKTELVMLPTNEKAPTHDYLFLYKPSNRLVKDGFVQNLYFLSDEEIKEGDWVCNGIDIWQVKSYYGFQPVTKKIIATTDKSLVNSNCCIAKEGLTKMNEGCRDRNRCLIPQPSTSFIEKYVEEYNKGNVITEVLVEYENSYKKNIDGEDIGFKVHEPSILKVNPKDNTITIRKAKDSWNRDEVIELLKSRESHIDCHTYSKQFIDKQEYRELDKWIQENL